MIWLLVLVGLAMVVLGMAVVFDPRHLRRALYWFVDSRNIYPVAVIRIGIGVLFVLAAPYVFLPSLIAGLGVILILIGVGVPMMGRSRLERLEQWWLTVSDPVLRLWGGAVAILGVLVIMSSL